MAENDRETRKYSLEEREYRGEDGKIHHHTNKYMDEHGRESNGRSASSGRAAESRSASSGRSGSSSGSRRSTGESRSSGARKSSGGGSTRSSREREEERENGGLGKALFATALGVAAVAGAAYVATRPRGERIIVTLEEDEMRAGSRGRSSGSHPSGTRSRGGVDRDDEVSGGRSSRSRGDTDADRGGMS